MQTVPVNPPKWSKKEEKPHHATGSFNYAKDSLLFFLIKTISSGGYEHRQTSEEEHVAEGNFPWILGRSWFSIIKDNRKKKRSLYLYTLCALTSNNLFPTSS